MPQIKIVLISDTHTKTEGFTIPECDLLIHAGDPTYQGKKNESLDFLEWFNSLDQATEKIYVAGNHEVRWDRAKQSDAQLEEWLMEARAKYGRIRYLEHESIKLFGLNIFGSPYTPDFFPEYWAFNLPRGERLKATWAQIPNDTNILISHGPAKGWLDWVPEGDGSGRYPGGHVGCADLRARIFQLYDLKLFVCGHLHDQYGSLDIPMRDRDLKYFNASILDDQYEVAHQPHVITLDI